MRTESSGFNHRVSSEPEHFRENDPGLIPYLRSINESESKQEQEEGRLIRQVWDLVKNITRNARHDADDCFQDAMKLVVNRLRECRANPKDKPINNFQNYVYRLATRVVMLYARNATPTHTKFRNELRYQLNKDSRFADLGKENGKRLWGLSSWVNQFPQITTSKRLMLLLEAPLEVEDAVLNGEDPQKLSLSDLAWSILDYVGHPARINHLASIIFDLKRIKEDVAGPNLDLLPVPYIGPSPYNLLETKEGVALCWKEIQNLSLNERRALLLNLTLTNGDLRVFWPNYLNSLQLIGEALELTDEHLARLWAELQSEKELPLLETYACYEEKFATLWLMLPLRDKTIANMLGTESQKIVSLRHNAVKKLRARLCKSK